MDERIATSMKCWIGIEKVDAGDLRGNELNELVENMTALNAPRRQFVNWGKLRKVGKVMRVTRRKKNGFRTA